MSRFEQRASNTREIYEKWFEFVARHELENYRVDANLSAAPVAHRYDDDTAAPFRAILRHKRPT